MTENCSQSARKYGLFNDIQTLSKKIEKDQTIATWDLFPVPFIKKSLGNNHRLIAAKQPVTNDDGDDIVIISFIACFSRGSDDYDRFCNDPQGVCGEYLPNKNDLREYIESRKEPLPPAPPQLNEAEYHYLYNILRLGEKPDMIIYESLDWVESMSDREAIWTRLYDSLCDLLGDQEIENNEIKIVPQSEMSILYKYFPSLKFLFLVGLFPTNETISVGSLKNTYENIIDSTELSEEAILKLSRRSYPAYILADEKLWRSIQQNGVGNIALSPEESFILEEVTRRTDKVDKVFPLFINGRPGSGKSTILQYLFASYLYMHLCADRQTQLPYPPLYLTYSETLLESAKKNIDEILKCNAYMAIYNNGPDQELVQKIHKKCYGIFHKFLLDIIPAEKQHLFSLEKKFDFPMFRDRWNNYRTKINIAEIRRLSPELVWHILRSYIKGMRYDEESDFSVESYKDLPKNQQTVQTETFKLVYDRVWLNWYKKLCEEEQLWDDQDLVFAVLNEPNINLSNYPAIFCDEAQDFTKLELDLILRLSLYSKKTMSSHEFKYIPFAFAGDPFQTLNPTGFEWSSLQANFHEKIVAGLDKLSIGKLEFNYHELSYNYRSGKYIVGLCNLLQLLRGILFEQKELKPQQNWFDKDSTMPVYFNLRDPLCEAKLIEQTELVIILPCQEGEEENYVKNDIFLQKLSENNIRNFLSPMRAKGLEFSRVVLYKFGSICHKEYPNLFEPLSSSEPHTEDIDASLPLKYFMNRLYVGASRAKKRLIIVDDDDGIRILWDNDNIKSLENLLELYGPASRLGWNTNIINYVQKGLQDNWTQDRDNPFALAEDFHNAGLAERDPYKLRLAEANYRRCGKEKNAKLCQAERLEIEEKFSEAGKLYLELDKIEKALECYWLIGNFEAINQASNFNNTPEQRASNFYLGSHDYRESKHFLSLLLEDIKSPYRIRIFRSITQWKKILDICVDSIPKALRVENPNREKAILLYGLLKEIELKGIAPSDNWKYAELAYLAQEYQDALKLWESKLDPKTNQNYCETKGRTSSYPDNLEWFDMIFNYTEVINQWEINKHEAIDIKFVTIILKALGKEEKYENIVFLLKKYPNESFLKQYYSFFKEKASTSYQETIGKLLIQMLANKGKWQDIVSLFDRRHNLKKGLLNSFSVSLANEVAKSKEFHETLLDDKIEVGKLLKNFFIDNESRSWENAVSFRIVGAAIEKAYKHIDAINFYEMIWKDPQGKVSESDVDYALIRWIKSKLRLAKSQEENGKIDIARRLRRDVDNIYGSRRINISRDNIPDDPDIDIPEPIPVVDKPIIPAITRNAIIQLYKSDSNLWSPDTLAKAFSLELDIVMAIIKNAE